MFFFSWIQLTALCYLASALLSPPSLLGSSVLPWWSWAILIALGYLWNRQLSKGHFGGGFLTGNLLYFLFSGVGALGWLQQSLSGSFWPNSLMNILVALVVQAAISYSFVKPLTEKLRTELWELGIILSSCAALLVSYYQLDIPYAAAVPLLIVVSGLFRQGLSPREESAEVTRSSKTNSFFIGMILILLTAGIAVLSLVGFVSDNSIGQALNSIIAAIVEFYKQLGPDTLDKAAKAVPFMDFDYTKLMESTSSSGVKAPFWFMLLLWITLAVTVILSFIVLVLYATIKLREFQRSMKSRNLRFVPGNKAGIGLLPTLSMFVQRLRLRLGFLRKKLKEFGQVLSFYIGICPKDIQGLYRCFLWWGALLGVKRRKGQTLREYREELAQSLAEVNPELALEMDRLTASYEQYCYGGDPQPLSLKEIKDVFQTLMKSRKVIRKASS